MDTELLLKFHPGKKFGGESFEADGVGPLNCQKCHRPWFEGPKMEVMIPQSDGSWEREMWCLGCIVKGGNLEMLEAE